MRTLPLLALSGCLSTNYQIPSKELDKCEPEVEAMERACIEQNGTLNKAVDEARACFTDRVVIICSDFGGIEGAGLYIGNYPQNEHSHSKNSKSLVGTLDGWKQDFRNSQAY